MTGSFVRIAATALALALPWTAPLAAAQDPSAAEAEPELARFLGDDLAAARLAAEALLAERDPARREASARALLAGFEDQPAAQRLRRAGLIAQLAGPAEVDRLARLSGDPDQDVRAALLPYFTRPDLSSAGLATRVTSLARIAGTDPAAELRSAAREGLGVLGVEESMEALARLVDELPAAEAAHAARQLGSSARGAPHVLALLAAARRATLEDAVLAALLPLYGEVLADASDAFVASPEAAAPLVTGLRHPSIEVRIAAGRSFDRLVDRLVTLGEGERTLALLARLARAGVEPTQVHLHRARLALALAGDPEEALRSARAMRGDLPPSRAGAALVLAHQGDVAQGRRWLYRSLELEALSHLALGNLDEARAGLGRARDVLDAALADAPDESSSGLDDATGQWAYAERLEDRALLEVSTILVELAGGAMVRDRGLLERARHAHLLSLEIQVRAARLTGDALLGWDTLLDADLSPYRLLFAGLSLPGMDIARAIELQASLGRVLASVAPREMPGFEPVPGLPDDLSDPLADPPRRALLEAVQAARLDGVVEEIDEHNRRLAQRGGSGWDIPEDELDELENLDLRRRMLQLEVLGADQRGPDALLEQRLPAGLALWLARDLRDEGRGPESREVAGRFRDDLDAGGLSNWWYTLGVERIVRAELAIGSSFTDDDEPRRAEETLQRAVERLEGLERRLRENGVAERDLAPFHSLRSNLLVSLAVNANVKLGEPEKALAYYEEAYELRQDDFMRGLLACYRARSGRDAEARDLLRDVRPGPQTWYNLACTHALLGDSAQALELLQRELEENHPSEASRQRQREWARSDPDLTSLRGDPRFEALVGAR